MKNPIEHTPNPSLDLLIERIVDVPKELVWRAWTTPELLKQWFTPAPWKTIDCDIDLRPGGRFMTVMQSPEGENFPGEGCFLEIVENRKLVWTSALLPGYRPQVPKEGDTCHDALTFTAVITLESHGAGTKYGALVIHADEESRKKHEDMGFHSGWNATLDQLVELVKPLVGAPR